MARYAGVNCHKRLIKDPQFAQGDYRAALKSTFLGIDEDILKGTNYLPSLFPPIAQLNCSLLNLSLWIFFLPFSSFLLLSSFFLAWIDPNHCHETSGCTAVSLLITKDNRLFCSNAGDSRCVLSSAGVAVPLSFDHKPTNEGEIARITAAGGFVHFGRVNGKKNHHFRRLHTHNIHTKFGYGEEQTFLSFFLSFFFFFFLQQTWLSPGPSVTLSSSATPAFLPRSSQWLVLLLFCFMISSFLQLPTFFVFSSKKPTLISLRGPSLPRMSLWCSPVTAFGMWCPTSKWLTSCGQRLPKASNLTRFANW